jgi:hypothetical protein
MKAKMEDERERVKKMGEKLDEHVNMCPLCPSNTSICAVASICARWMTPIRRSPWPVPLKKFFFISINDRFMGKNTSIQYNGPLNRPNMTHFDWTRGRGSSCTRVPVAPGSELHQCGSELHQGGSELHPIFFNYFKNPMSATVVFFIL